MMIENVSRDAYHVSIRGTGKTDELVRRVVDAVREAMPPEVVVRGELDAAWAEAEAALPEGCFLRLEHDPSVSDLPSAAESVGDVAWARTVRVDSDSPAAALRALAAKLRERPARFLARRTTMSDPDFRLYAEAEGLSKEERAEYEAKVKEAAAKIADALSKELGRQVTFDTTRHRLLAAPDHILDGLTCWCRPYRDAEDPDIIIHRPEAKA